MFFYLLSFASGILVKAVDWIEDDLKKKHWVRWPLAAIAGLLIGYVIAYSSFANIFLAAVFAQIFARKIDTNTHMLTVLLAALVFFFAGGIASFELWHFLIFLIPAFLDEMKFPGRFAGINEYRPFLDITGLLFGLALGRWDYFFGIISFDAGYLGFKLVTAKRGR
jgi:hypothetical protein